MKALIENLLVTVSGGRSSAMTARHIQTHRKYAHFNKVYCFANTGMERPETIQFLKDIVHHWGIDLHLIEGVYSTEKGVGIRYKLVDFDELDMDAKVFSGCIANSAKGKFDALPNTTAPYCSDRMKVVPIDKFCKDYFGTTKYIKSVGFRKEDMPRRISWAEIKEDDKRIFPLITDFPQPIGIPELEKFWDVQPFKLNLNSRFGNCELCWKKSDKTLIKIIQNGSKHIDWWRKMEEKYNDTSFRHKKSINDLVKAANQGTQAELDFGDDDYNCMCSI
jgi:hypothetical protein